jgi:hypothetical protein
MNVRDRQSLTLGRRHPGAALLACLTLLVGCGREAALPDARDAAPAEAEPRTVDETLVDLLAPPAPSGADSRTVRLAERERDLSRQVLALSKRRDDVVRDQTVANPDIQALYQQMTDAREAFQQRVAALPEVTELEHQIGLLRKQLQAIRQLAQKSTEEKQP